jgi:peptidoglycan-associated lipoprotein
MPDVRLRANRRALRRLPDPNELKEYVMNSSHQPRFRLLHLATFGAAAVAAVACSAEPTPPPATPIAPAARPALAAVPEKEAPTKDGAPVGIDDRIVKMCNLPVAHFGFDSSSIGTSASRALKAIADCFVSGPAKGKDIRIVGHADSRGETEYNFALGQRRAGSVAQYLTRVGMPESQIATSSRGELEASGTNASSWSADRKVEIFLGN